MSFLFKAVLGQRVVHPPPSATGKEPQATENGVSDTKSSATPLGKLATASLNTNEDHGSTSTSKSSCEAAGSSSSRPGPFGASPASLGGPQSSYFSPSPSPRPSTPTRTLLLRIEGCTVAQDIRDAQRELLRCADLPYALDATSLKSLLDLLVSYAEDESITEPTLHLLANATDLDLYPDQIESNRRVVEVTAAAKRDARDALLQHLVGSVPLLLDCMKEPASFWSRYHVVVLLQRLEGFDPYKLNQALLGARGISVLLDALNEVEHDHQLRNQALALLTSLTLADAELQTLLAFHNAFDSLFDVMEREGSERHAKSIVQDCLTVMQNMLRSNKATQKLFREMGCAARLAALFDSVPSALAACTVVAHRHRGAGSSSSEPPLPQPIVLTEKLEALLDVMKASDTMRNMLMSVSILACVLRGSDEGGEERHSTQDALLRCGILTPLTRLAFSGLAIDDATRIESVRVLALLLSGSKQAVEEWLSLPPVTTLVRHTLPYSMQVWPAARALLSYVCETTDTTLVSAGVQLFTAVLNVPALQERSVGVFLSGLVLPTPACGGGRNCNPTAQASASTSPDRAQAPDHSVARADAQCGAALAHVLLSARTSAVEKFYAAQVLRALVMVPGATQMLQALVHSPVPPHLQTSMLEGFVKAQPGWTLSSRLSPSFFNYTVTFVLFCLSGGAAAQQVNTATLGAYVGALLAWMGSCPLAAATFVEEGSWGEALLHQTRREGAANVRLWSAVVVASACVVASKATSAAAAAKTLAHQFVQMLGGGAALDTILFDVQASTPAWQHPVASGLRTQNPTPYDEALVALMEQLVVEFKQLLTSVSGASPHAPSPMMTLPLLPHSAQQHPNDALKGRGVALSLVAPSPPSEPPTASLVSLGQSIMSSADYRVEPPPPPPPDAPPHPVVAPLGSDAQTRELLAALQAELEAARAEKESLLNTLGEWRERAERTSAQCAALEEEHERRAAAAAEEERMRREEAAALSAEAAHSHAASADMVEGLLENIRLLEEALKSKEEEHQQLVESLNMMEEQLLHASYTTAAAASQQQEFLQQRQHQEEQRRSAPQDVLDAMEAEREAVTQQLALAREEIARLQRELQSVSSDYGELLLLVAELNEECLSVKAGSSMAHTPARPWSEDAGFDLKRGVEATQDAAFCDAVRSGEAFFAGAERLPLVAAAPERVQLENATGFVAMGVLKDEGPEPAASTQAPTLVMAAERKMSADADWTSGASVDTFEAATDVTINHPGARPPGHAVAVPPLSQQLFSLPAAPAAAYPISSLSLSQVDATLPSPLPPAQHGGQPQQHAGQLPPPPGGHAAPPPPPPTTHQHPLRRSALQAPRYADLSTIFVGDGDGASAEAEQRQYDVLSTSGEQRAHERRLTSPPERRSPPATQLSPQVTAPSHLPPERRPQYGLLSNKPPSSSGHAEMRHDAGVVELSAHSSMKGMTLAASQSPLGAAVMDAVPMAKDNTLIFSSTLHCAQQSAPSATAVGVADGSVANPFSAGSESLADNRSGLEMGDGGFETAAQVVREGDAAHWPMAPPWAATNVAPQQNAAASTSETSLRFRPEPGSLDHNEAVSTSTAPYNPFADLGGGGDDADDAFGDLR
ncbi:hypothetical protein LSCM4_01430 [Leishmania orientalis]|uniref:Vesicle tethering protein Uso1/P115-like head domain-containing protein n=1 Tax=Leishmania orientalis TaxID=2249476 RepID=A0A836G6G5_9TRYP|nr:hypothetical protein LSCM4_01430 [Leishmania orientalis]